MSQLPALIPVPLLLLAIVGLLAGLRRRALGYWICLVGVLGAFAVSFVGLLHVARNGEIRYAMGGWTPPVGIEYVLDPLSGFLTTLITAIGVLAMVYAPRSLRFEVPEKEAYVYPAILLLLAGLTGIALTGDIFNLYVFIEIASLAAYALLAIGNPRAPLAVFRYLIIGAVGGGFYLLGVGFLYFSVGTLNMADLAARLPELLELRSVMAAAILMTVGLGLKMALFPMHQWLPDVYTYAPSAIAALVAPIMTKVSAYAILRLYLDVFTFEYVAEILPLAAVVAWLSAAGILYSSVLAIAQTDLRRMLAYSSVGQLAYIGLGIGLANPFGIIGALLHMVNHAFMKACLFLVAGGIRMRTGNLEIPSFVGLGRRMPWTMGAFTVGALAMVGIPPTAGFFSKIYLLRATVDAGSWIFFSVIVLSSLLSAVYFFRVIEMIYTEKPEESPSLGGALGGRGEPEPPPPGPWAWGWLPALAGPGGGRDLAAAAVSPGSGGPGGASPGGGGEAGGRPDAGGAVHGGGGGIAAAPMERGLDRPGPELPPTMLWPILVAAAGTVILGLINVLIVRGVLELVAAPLGG